MIVKLIYSAPQFEEFTMSQQQKDDQQEVEPMETVCPHKQTILGCDPFVFIILLLFFLLFLTLLPSAWSLMVGAVVLGLGIRWAVLGYEKYQRKDRGKTQ